MTIKDIETSTILSSKQDVGQKIMLNHT